MQIQIKNNLKEISIFIKIWGKKFLPWGEPKFRSAKKPQSKELHFAYEVKNTSLLNFIIYTMLFLEGIFSFSVFGLSLGREFTLLIF